MFGIVLETTDDAAAVVPAEGWLPPGSELWENRCKGRAEPFVVMWSRDDPDAHVTVELAPLEREDPLDAARGCLTAAAAGAVFWTLVALLFHYFFM